MILGECGQSIMHGVEAYQERSVNRHLPQTPRSPSTTAAHYFDDILTKQKKGGPRALRRSSTTRNLGNGQIDDENDAPTTFRRVSSIGYPDEEALKRKAEIDQHFANFAANQLQRMRTNESTSADGMLDEIETQFDGALDWERTSEWEVQSP